MKKVMVSILLILFSATATACSAGQNNAVNNNSTIAATVQQPVKVIANSSSVDYEIIKQAYIDGEITVSYPQITKLSDSKGQEKINEIIKTEALKIANGWTDQDKVTIDINYEIKWQGAGLLSIEYSGYLNPHGAAHPTNVFYTTSINMREGKRLQLKDLVNIDDNFVERMKKGKIIAVSPEITFDSLGYSNDDLIKAFKTADVRGNPEDTYGTFCYFTNDSLGISLEVCHALGDHVELEVKYQDIADSVKPKNKVWQEIYK